MRSKHAMEKQMQPSLDKKNCCYQSKQPASKLSLAQVHQPVSKPTKNPGPISQSHVLK